MQTKTLNLSLVLAIMALLIGSTQPAIVANPSNIELDYNKTGTHLAQGTKVGNLQVKPHDTSDYQFELVSGAGAKHNHLFKVQNHSLLTDKVIKSAGKKWIRARAMSQKDTIESALTVQVVNNFYPKTVMTDFYKKNSISSTINIKDTSKIHSIEVMLMVNYTNLDSFKAHLTHKATSTNINLIKSLSFNGNCDNDTMLLTLTPHAKSKVNGVCPTIYDTSYQATLSLLNFSKKSMKGDWKIEIEFPSVTSPSDSGIFKRWAINVRETQPNPKNGIIEITNQIINKNDSIGTKVGQLEVVSSPMDSNISYNLIKGTGDTHNHLFTLTKKSIYVDASPLNSGKKSIRLKASNKENTIEQELGILVDGDTSYNNSNSGSETNYINDLDTTKYNNVEELQKDRLQSKIGSNNFDSVIVFNDDSTKKSVISRDSARSAKKSEATSTLMEDKEKQVISPSFYPNPFNQSTSLHYKLNKKGTISLRIFNIRGELIRHMKRDNQAPGEHKMQWDGKNRKGQMAKKGTFLYSFEIIDQKGTMVKQRSGKIVRLK